ncbi:MAG: O-antigen ligase family protein [Micavibrio aeruginosavorus]|nr:O-antigen ligase family protein [Micavibrio aeruginosavorus]
MSNPVLAALLWTIALFLSLWPDSVLSAEITRLLAVLAAMTGAGMLAFAGGDVAKRVVAAPKLAAAVVLLWLLTAVSCIWSVAPGTTLVYAGIFSVMPATLLALLFASPQPRETFLKALAFMSGGLVLLMALWALAQVFIVQEYLVSGQVRHPFANPNAYAGFLNLAAFAALGLCFQAKGGWTRRVLLAGLVVIGAALAAISSQAAALTMGGGLILSFALLRGGLPAGAWKTLAGVFAFVIVIGAVMGMMPGKTDLVTRFGYLIAGHAESWDNRLDIWRAALALIAQHPFLGTGYRTFFLTYPSVRLPSEIYSGGYMVHSDPLEYWVEIGVAGVVLFYAIGIIAVMRFARWFRANPQCDPLTVFLFCGCAAFIVHTHVDFLLYTMPTMMLFALAFGVLMVRTAAGDEVAATPFSFTATLPPQGQVFAAVLPVFLLLGVFVPLMLGEHYASRAAALIRKDDVEGFAQAVNAANRVNMGLSARPYLMAATVPLSILKNRFPAIPQEEQKALFTQTDGLLARALRQNSRSAAAWYHRGDLARLVNPSVLPDNYPKAEDSFAKALEIDPLHLPARVALAEIRQASGDDKAALDLLAAGLRWPYPVFDALPYFEKTAVLAKRLGRGDIAEQAEKARYIHITRLASAEKQRRALDALKEDGLFLP